MLKKISSALLALFLLTGASYAQLHTRVAQAINDLKAVNGGTQYSNLTVEQKKQAIALMLSTDENGNTNTNLAGKIQAALANVRVGRNGDFNPTVVAAAMERDRGLRRTPAFFRLRTTPPPSSENSGDTPPASSENDGDTPPPSTEYDGDTPTSNNDSTNQGGANGSGDGGPPPPSGSPPSTPPGGGPPDPSPGNFGDGGTLGSGGDLTGSLGQDQVNQTVRTNPTIAEVILEEVGGSASLN